MRDVLVLHAELGAGSAWPGAAALLERLPYAQRLALERRAPQDRYASLAGIALLLAGARQLGGQSADPARLRFPQGGKPRLEGGPHFSLSHSAARVAVALSSRCEVGLDVEERAGAPRPLARRVATEAVLKAVGAGLRDWRHVRLEPGLRAARYADSRLHLRPLRLAAGCVARLATAQPVHGVEVVRVDAGW